MAGKAESWRTFSLLLSDTDYWPSWRAAFRDQTYCGTGCQLQFSPAQLQRIQISVQCPDAFGVTAERCPPRSPATAGGL
jgi:hypothetical protein